MAHIPDASARRNRAGGRKPRALAGAALIAGSLALWSAPSHAFRFGSDDGSGISGSFDSIVSFGFITRLKSADCAILGNDTGGCNNGTSNALSNVYNLNAGTGYANADFNYTNFDDGDLNYKKNDIVSMVLKGTHDLSLKAPGGWSALVRATWFRDFKVDDTSRMPLNSEAKDYAVDDITLLDAWISKSFDFNGRRAKVKLGNQVISWGEDIFILGGVNQVNAIDLQKFHVPGTQLKEIFIPAPMLWGSFPLTDEANLEAYYQFRWNGFKFDPVGTFFSAADVVGRGKKPGYLPTSIVDDFFGAGTCAATTPTGRCGDPLVSGLDDATLIANGLAVPFSHEKRPKHSGQYGLAFRYRPESFDAELGFYYQRYHDKLPFLGFTGDNTGAVTSYFWAYGQDKDLYGASISSKLGPVAVGAEISYRPKDSVGIDPTVPFGNIFGGASNPYSVYELGSQPGYVEERKWQAHLTAFYLFSPNDPLGWLASGLGASDGFILAEAAVAHYPNLDRSGRIPYFLPNYGIPDKTSWGYVFELGLNYPNAFGSGVMVTPQIDWFHDVDGTSPNTIPFVDGRKALTLSLLFNYRDRWKGALQWVQFWGGGANNVMRDRDFLGASISYSF